MNPELTEDLLAAAPVGSTLRRQRGQVPVAAVAVLAENATGDAYRWWRLSSAEVPGGWATTKDLFEPAVRRRWRLVWPADTTAAQRAEAARRGEVPPTEWTAADEADDRPAPEDHSTLTARPEGITVGEWAVMGDTARTGRIEGMTLAELRDLGAAATREATEYRAAAEARSQLAVALSDALHGAADAFDEDRPPHVVVAEDGTGRWA